MRLKSQKSAGHLRVILEDRQRELRGQQDFFNALLRESLASQQERAHQMVSGVVDRKVTGVPAVACDVADTSMPKAADPFVR